MGVLGVLVGVQRSQGASWERLMVVPGRFCGGSGEALQNVTFCFVRCEFVNDLMKS